jgi:uncharacterized RDD family membrane protein YckC
LGRRLVALCIDWAVAEVLCVLFTRPADLADRNSFLTYGIFAALQIVFLSTLSGSIGHIVMGLRLVPLQPAWIGVLKPAIRTALLCLVIPAVIWDHDQRGLHDRLVGTVLVRRASRT